MVSDATEKVTRMAGVEKVLQGTAAQLGKSLSTDDIDAIRRFVGRSNYRVVPVDDEVIKSQQAVADRFAKLGLIPKPVNVKDIVWKWTQGS